MEDDCLQAPQPQLQSGERTSFDRVMGRPNRSRRAEKESCSCFWRPTPHDWWHWSSRRSGTFATRQENPNISREQAWDNHGTFTRNDLHIMKWASASRSESLICALCWKLPPQRTTPWIGADITHSRLQRGLCDQEHQASYDGTRDDKMTSEKTLN